MADTKQQLREAFNLINQDRLDDAIAIIEPITRREPDNADAWWLMANASSEPRDARRALMTLLKLNPQYPKARDLLDKLNELYPPRDDELAMMMEIDDVEPDLPGWGDLETDTDSGFGDIDTDAIEDAFGSSEIDELFSEDLEDKEAEKTETASRSAAPFDFSDAEESTSTKDGEDFGEELQGDPFGYLWEEDEKRAAKGGSGAGGSRRRLLLLGLVALVAIFLLVGALAVLSGGDDDDGTDDDDTTVAVADPGQLVAIEATQIDEENSARIDAIRISAQSNAQEQLGSDATAVLAQNGDNFALVVQVCAEPTPQISQIAAMGMEIAARQAALQNSSDADVTMVGVSIEDCQNDDDTLFRAIAPLSAASEFLQSGDFAAFRLTWATES